MRYVATSWYRDSSPLQTAVRPRAAIKETMEKRKVYPNMVDVRRGLSTGQGELR